jgi:uncharacterized protein YgbK (DUF1537 family)
VTSLLLPAGPLLSWYGDDFTGSSAMMEAMSLAGLPAVLFFDVPTPEQRAKFADYRGIGLAGVARAQNRAWMQSNLPRFYQALADIGAPVSQYKICSTLDSSPEIGSIGAALEIGLPYLGGEWIPFIAAAPPIGRFQLFANLFADANGTGYRLDRHPTMSRHPVTPMHEADVRLHLAAQTGIPIGLVDYPALRAGRGAEVLSAQLAMGKHIITIDVLDDESLAEAGALIWERRGKRIFAVGSQGIPYALAAYFRRSGALTAPVKPMHAGKVDRIAVVCGSCSPITAAQIAWAERSGFALIRVDPRKALEVSAWKCELDRATAQAESVLGAGKDPLIYTARGPDDPAVGAFFTAVAAVGADPLAANETIGTGLGRVLDTLIRRSKIRRGVIVGGDTSSYAAQVLDIYALTLAAATAPGAALFKAHSADPAFAGLEIALKGGQMGAPEYFGQIKNGGAAAHTEGA